MASSWLHVKMDCHKHSKLHSHRRTHETAQPYRYWLNTHVIRPCKAWWRQLVQDGTLTKTLKARLVTYTMQQKGCPALRAGSG